MSQLTLSNAVERVLKERVDGVTKVVPADFDGPSVAGFDDFF